MSTEVPAFVIRELSGQRRAISLRDRALPYRPFSLEGEQRVKVSNPAGNPEGFGTVIGPTEGEAKIEGMWKDIFIGTNLSGRPMILTFAPRTGSNTAGEMTPVSNVIDAINLLDSFRIDGQLLEVEWGPVRRRGYIKKVTQKWHNIHDCEWGIDFAWVSRAIPAGRPSYAAPVAGHMDTGSNLRESIGRLMRALDAPGQLIDEQMSDLRSNINRLTDATYAIDNAISGALDSTAPSSIVGPVQALLGGVVADATSIYNSFENSGWSGALVDFRRFVPYSQHISSTNPTSAFDTADALLLEQIDPVQQMQGQLYESETRQDARATRDEAELRRRSMNSDDGSFVGIYRARGGEDLRAVSRLYFGTPDQWRQIMLDNAITESILAEGQEVRVYRHEESRI